MLTFKQKIQNFFLPLGSVQKIRSGYLKGYKIRLTQNSLWSPLIGNWEPAMQKIMVNVIKPGQVIYDLGANNGLHGLLMAPIIGPEGMLYNFEPFEENIREINENYAMNHITNFRNIQAAVSDNNGTASFVIGDHHKQGHLSTEAQVMEEKIKVESISLDSFIDLGNPGPDFMKIDIEGAEGPSLRGFSKGIMEFKPLMIIELHNPEQDLEVGKTLAEHGYTAFRFDTFRKLEFTQIKDFYKSHPHPDGVWGSLFCIPSGKKLSDYSFDK
jgi:FkbM family methyltransferase